MKNLKLTFSERIGLLNVLAAANGPLGKMAALQLVYKQVLLTEEEDRQVVRKPMADGREELSTPSKSFGAIEVAIEENSAETLKRELEEYRGFHVNDVAWVTAVKEQLGAPSVFPSRKKR